MGQWLLSWQLLNQLRDARILTSGIPYNVVASACEKATEWKSALQIIMEVERNRLSTAVTYGFLVFALGGLGALCILHALGPDETLQSSMKSSSHRRALVEDLHCGIESND